MSGLEHANLRGPVESLYVCTLTDTLHLNVANVFFVLQSYTYQYIAFVHKSHRVQYHMFIYKI